MANDVPQNPGTGFNTQRLILRPWRESDVPMFCRLNADPRVMEFFPSTLNEDQALAMVQRIENQFRLHRYGLWAIEIPNECPFIGFVGLQIPRFAAPFMPCVEIGWRLAADYWGRGLATEAALKALEIGFDVFKLNEFVSMTAVINTRSRRVMEKIGMHCSRADDFDHPKVPPKSRISRHVLYRLTAGEFCLRRKTSLC